MDWYQIATLIISVLFGGQGVRAWMKAKDAKAKGLPPDEAVARAAPDYYRDQRRDLFEARREASALRRLRQEDAEYIDELEAHIWGQKPPPPPLRRRKPRG